MSPKFYQIGQTAEGVFKDRGSKFLSFAYPVFKKEDVLEIIQLLKKKYYDANHHCYAYRLGEAGEVEYATDDREPAHSAGTPILGVIKHEALTDILIVVVRYFGGTKLGVRGLINAYRTAAEESLTLLPKIPIILMDEYELSFAYDQTSLISRILHKFEYKLLEDSYTHICSKRIAIEQIHSETFFHTIHEAGINIKKKH